ncbi:phytoene desaturase family protein [Nocardioides sp.]|uniref:phytoene desaturase family protein n=1 Tax=Nocardioides sp. TaxID=35761 RepID=UPI002ED33376
MSPAQPSYDVTVVGGGHNALAAAAYLARAGLSVLVFDRLDHMGGATASVDSFPGHGVRLARYAALGSSLPAQLVSDLDLDLRLRPQPAPSAPATDAGAWEAFDTDLAKLLDVVAPTLLEPLPTERVIRDQVPDDIWDDLVVNPLGAAIERRFTDDAVRAALAGDALSAGSTSLADAALTQNRCFLYRRLGSATDGWQAPVGGPTALSDALIRAATEAGAELVSATGVSAIRGDDDEAEVTWHRAGESGTVRARHVLGGVAPWVLRILMGEGEEPETKPAGSQLVVNLLLDRLPTLASCVDPRVAFARTTYVGTEPSRLEAAYAEAADGRLPASLPLRVECPSLADPAVLGDSPAGHHTLALLASHVPASLFAGDHDARKSEAVERVLATLDAHLAEPIADCLATDSEGRPCIAATTPQEVEAELAMPGGHLFHGDLDWPWAPNRARLETPAQQWGVQTDLGSVLVCGAGARRGGAVSAVAGHNAAQAVLASR